jgi:hypothetical protein
MLQWTLQNLLICDVLVAEHYNWCTVPLSGYDVIVFGAMAVVFSLFCSLKFADWARPYNIARRGRKAVHEGPV